MWWVGGESIDRSVDGLALIILSPSAQARSGRTLWSSQFSRQYCPLFIFTVSSEAWSSTTVMGGRSSSVVGGAAAAAAAGVVAVSVMMKEGLGMDVMWAVGLDWLAGIWLVETPPRSRPPL